MHLRSAAVLFVGIIILIRSYFVDIFAHAEQILAVSEFDVLYEENHIVKGFGFQQILHPVEQVLYGLMIVGLLANYFFINENRRNWGVHIAPLLYLLYLSLRIYLAKASEVDNFDTSGDVEEGILSQAVINQPGYIFFHVGLIFTALGIISFQPKSKKQLEELLNKETKPQKVEIKHEY